MRKSEAGRLTDLGFLTGDALYSAIRGAAFTLFPSTWYENYPYSALEPIILGVPVVGSRIGGVPEIIHEGMTGELFEIKKDQFKVVSLDGHRISVRNITLKNSYDDNSVIVPGKTLQELSKIIPGDVDKDVSIFLCDNHVIFEYDSVKVVSRIIEGNYFKIDQMISNDYETKIDVSKKELLEVINRSTLLVKEGDKKPIVFNVKDDMATLSITSTIGSMNDDVDIKKSGKDIMIGFNPKFLIDALRVIDDEIVTLYMVNPKAPCIIKNDDGSYLYLILPVNFS